MRVDRARMSRGSVHLARRAIVYLSVVSVAHADDFPRRAITMIVPFAPGGVTDQVRVSSPPRSRTTSAIPSSWKTGPEPAAKLRRASSSKRIRTATPFWSVISVRTRSTPRSTARISELCLLALRHFNPAYVAVGSCSGTDATLQPSGSSSASVRNAILSFGNVIDPRRERSAIAPSGK